MTESICNSPASMEEIASRLEASGDYRILRRLRPRPTGAPAGADDKIGVIIDLETTGLDPVKDEPIELGMVKFAYSAAGEITAVVDVFQAFRQPTIAIPDEVTVITGLTDDLVAGHAIDDAAVAAFATDAHIVIAHNAGFDRKFAERFWPLFADKHWACSMLEIDWKALGLAGARLSYLLADAGLFHDAHRAVDDCHALLEILARPLGASSETGLGVLLGRARRRSVRIWAENAPFDLKDVLKKRGYRWSDGSDGSPRAWHIDVDQDDHPQEMDYLRREIYQREIDLRCRVLTAKERFS
jgi:DNA polymerase-3 subunit epsilon